MSYEQDQILDRLIFTTEALRNVSSDPSGPSFNALLDERSSQIQFFRKLANEHGVSSQHAGRLRRLITLGDEVRTPLLVRRALLRERLDELQAARRNQRALLAPQASAGRRLDVRG